MLEDVSEGKRGGYPGRAEFSAFIDSSKNARQGATESRDAGTLLR